MKEIKITYNYDQFKSFDGNRGINQLHLKRLIKSMKENFLINPIFVNEKNEIIDGNHRFYACKATGNPIYYIIYNGWGIAEAHLLNATRKNWTTEEYLNGYCDLGNENYIRFRDFKNQNSEFGFISLFSFGMNRNSRADQSAINNYREGLFVFKNPMEAQAKIDKIKAIKRYYSGYARNTFVNAMLYLLSKDNFNYNVFLAKLKYQSTKLVDCTNTKQYISVIEEIYNFKSREKVRFY